MQDKRTRAIGNRRAQTLAQEGLPQNERKCLEGCGKTVTGKAVFASATCRKKWQRRKEKEIATAEAPAAKT